MLIKKINYEFINKEKIQRLGATIPHKKKNTTSAINY
jgi:hypothetical protein